MDSINHLFSLQCDIIKGNHGLQCGLPERSPVRSDSLSECTCISRSWCWCIYVCVSMQRYHNGVSGQCDHSSGVPAVGGERAGAQAEDRQRSGPGVSSDRSVYETGVACSIQQKWFLWSSPAKKLRCIGGRQFKSKLNHKTKRFFGTHGQFTKFIATFLH